MGKKKDSSTPTTEPAKAARPLKPKAYTVITPEGVSTIVYALTTAGAIARAKAERNPPKEDWSATLATGEEMFNAARDGVRILDAPESLGYVGPDKDQQDLPIE